ncbi:hypothetical protein [Buttiauxella noackiae]|uniref:hypothetical protein n=1 Tax=Buttiauxella noackiae TaxID=82992 RepID=UPI0005559FC4|nr:hypothetical protein [Buttiauxella noackiae]
MNEHTENVSNKKLLKGVGIFIVMFIAMCWILTKTEENDGQAKSQQPVITSVAVEPTPPPIEDSAPVRTTYHYTPEELQAEFKANEVRITNKLDSNILILHGKISDIGLSFGKPVVGIAIPGSHDTIRAFFESYLSDDISELNVGDSVRVRSRDVSLNPFGAIHLRKSLIMPDTNN